MSKKKPKTKRMPDAGCQKPVSVSLAPATGIRHPASLLPALGLIAFAALRIVATWPETGLTWDEPGHMACGMQYLAQHVYRYEAQHPPLARVMSALGPYLDGVRPLNGQNQDL